MVVSKIIDNVVFRIFEAVAYQLAHSIEQEWSEWTGRFFLVGGLPFEIYL